MSPEYALDGLFSIKSDVFSFGVLVLEIVSGKRNRGFVQSENETNFIAYVWGLYNEGRSMDIADPSCVESCHPDELPAANFSSSTYTEGSVNKCTNTEVDAR
ncbi:hypothetical protein M8C21_003458 [Ambrosia artemisiifolia]|uniref:Serine-threonine/tyrosine-protein kinase catalytic domain-containing protein n=1 Tax=Ambrosia artemisiifolia TaxID=4212 RepID=A0AAD5G190_AMBAR|nr:hypothetical protein M8C21_003458 [Ambrosia artemisiifolia]